MDKTTQTIARFETPMEAELARGLLESAGIRCFLGNARLTNWFWHLSNATGGVTLSVPTEEAGEALDILSDQRARARESQAEDAFPEEARKRRSLWVIVFALFAFPPLAPILLVIMFARWLLAEDASDDGSPCESEDRGT